MFAHVRYVEDNLKAVVFVTLIRNFSPKRVSDYDKAHLYETYWRSPEGTEERYYSALILQVEVKTLLNVKSKEDMIRNPLKSRGTALPVIFGDPKTAIQASHAISRKEKALAKKGARKKEMKEILEKSIQAAPRETSDDNDEEYVPQKLLTIEKQSNAQLEKELERVRAELAASRKEVEEERRLRAALSWTLLSKFDDDELHIAKARPSQHANVNTLGYVIFLLFIRNAPFAEASVNCVILCVTIKQHLSCFHNYWSTPTGLHPTSARLSMLEKRLGPTNRKVRQLQVAASLGNLPSLTSSHSISSNRHRERAWPSFSTPPSAGRKTSAQKPQGAAATSHGQLGQSLEPSISEKPTLPYGLSYADQLLGRMRHSFLGVRSFPGTLEQVMGPLIEALHSGHAAANHAGDRGKDQDKNFETGLREDLVECVDWDVDWDIDEDVGGDVRGHFAEDGGDGNVRDVATDGDDVGENRSSSTPLFQVQEGQVKIISTQKQKFEFVFDEKTDSKCVKDAARTMWSTAELLECSVSGKQCKRYLKLGALVKKRMTPEKKAAILNMYRKYIQDNPSMKKIAVLADPNLSFDKRVTSAV
ncbi:unnamed protein product [Ixodes persulcatus]